MSIDQHGRPNSYGKGFFPSIECPKVIGVFQYELVSRDSALAEVLGEIADSINRDRPPSLLLMDVPTSAGVNQLALVGACYGEAGVPEIVSTHWVHICEEFESGVASAILLEGDDVEAYGHFELDSPGEIAAFTRLYEAYVKETRLAEAQNN